MSNKPNDGGPAFPFKCQGPTTAPEFYYGMSLRDWFAGKALTALINVHVKGSETKFDDWLASRSYEIAVAMLRAKEARDE